MTTELILLLTLYAFILLGVFLKGPQTSFYESAPALAARVERHIITGDGFISAVNQAPLKWNQPSQRPDGRY